MRDIVSSLKDLEETMTPNQLELYNIRLEEGFDVTTDKLYLEWKNMKLAIAAIAKKTNRSTVASTMKSTLPATPRMPLQPIRPREKVSPVFKEILSYPKAKAKKGKQKAAMPNHLT